MKKIILCFLTLMMAAVVMPASAQKMKKTKACSGMVYHSLVDKEKIPYGPGTLVVKQDHELDNYGREMYSYAQHKIDFKEINYTEEKAVLTVDTLLGDLHCKCTLTVAHSNEHKLKEVTLTDGSITKEGVTYEIPKEGLKLKFPSFELPDKVELHSYFVPAKDLSISLNPEELSLLKGDKFRLNTEAEGKRFSIKSIEGEDGALYTFYKYREYDFYSIIGLQMGDRNVRIFQDEIAIGQHKSLRIKDADNTYGIAKITSLHKAVIDTQEGQEGNYLFKYTTCEMPDGKSSYVGYVVAENGKPILFPDFGEDMIYTTDMKRILFDLIRRNVDVEWQTYNLAYEDTFIYRGVDLSKEYQAHVAKYLKSITPTVKGVTGTWNGQYHGYYATYVFNANGTGKVVINRSGGSVTIPYSWKLKERSLILTVRNASASIKINGLSTSQINQAIKQYKQIGTVTETYNAYVSSSSVLVVDGIEFHRKQ